MEQNAIHKRRAARRLAMQALYSWQFNDEDPGALIDSFKGDEEYIRVDKDYFRDLVSGVISAKEELDVSIGKHVSRSAEQLDQVEQAVLRIATFELMHRHETPFKVVVSEAVSLAKKFGAQDGYKFVNGVLDKMSTELRAFEASADKD